MSSRAKEGMRRVGVGVGLFAAGAVLGGFGTQLLDNDAEPAEAAAEPSASYQAVGGDGPISCAIYDVPSIEYPALPARSTLTEGAPYVIVCQDSSGGEVLNELFVHQGSASS